MAHCFLTLGEPKITVLGIDGFVGPKIKILKILEFLTNKSVWVGVKNFNLKCESPTYGRIDKERLRRKNLVLGINRREHFNILK